MIERLKVMERDKAQIEESAMLKEKEQLMEV
jgi:hypothetical protein